MTYTKEQVKEASQNYFEGEALPAGVFADKYALRDREERFYELVPTDMHWRLAREFARAEAPYPNAMTAEQIFPYLDGFRWIVPQGSPMFGIGNPYQLVSLSNCSVIAGPDDTMSSIMERGRDLANLYKRRFGAGLDISKLRPAGSSVNNAAITSTGAWSFADLYSYITRMVGQSGRRGALMLTMDARHPDIEKFITMKADLTKVTGANVSVRVTDDFMQAVKDDGAILLHWPIGTDLVKKRFERPAKAREIFNLIAAQACQTAEPGLLFWDTIQKNLPLDYYRAYGFETLCTNPCGELPLPDGDSCRLISIPLFNFVVNPFTPNAYFDRAKFREVVRVGQRLCDDLIDLELEKLRAIRDSADTQDEIDLFTRFIEMCENGRRTGLGTHGLADMLARLGLRYGSEESLAFVDALYEDFKIAAYASSIEMAEERGAFPIWDNDIELDCPYLRALPLHLQKRMEKVGRRNGALLTNAPTGSVSILSENCSSGIEPVFLNGYTRRRKIDAQKEDTSKAFKDQNGDYWIEFEVLHPNVEKYYRHAYGEYLAAQGDAEFEDFKMWHPLPDYFVTSDQIDPMDRVRMQAAITKHIDHSVSSTLNLPKGTTPEQIAEIYMAAWELGCKGMTVYVDGSRDAQVLSAKAEAPKVEINASVSDIEKELTQTRNELAIINAAYMAAVKEMRTLEQTIDAATSAKKLGEARTHRGIETEGSMFKATFQNMEGSSRKVYVYVGTNADGHPVEVFITDEKGDEDLKPYASAVGKLTSLLLKYGVPCEEIEDTLIGLKGASISYTGKVFNSVPDLVGKRLRAVREQQELDVIYTAIPPLDMAKLDKADLIVPATETRAPDGFRYFGSIVAEATAKVTDVTDNGEIQPPTFATGLRGQPTKVIAKGDTCPSCKQTNVRRVDGCPSCPDCGWAKCA